MTGATTFRPVATPETSRGRLTPWSADGTARTSRATPAASLPAETEAKKVEDRVGKYFALLLGGNLYHVFDFAMAPQPMKTDYTNLLVKADGNNLTKSDLYDYFKSKGVEVSDELMEKMVGNDNKVSREEFLNGINSMVVTIYHALGEPIDLKRLVESGDGGEARRFATRVKEKFSEYGSCKSFYVIDAKKGRDYLMKIFNQPNNKALLSFLQSADLPDRAEYAGIIIKGAQQNLDPEAVLDQIMVQMFGKLRDKMYIAPRDSDGGDKAFKEDRDRDQAMAALMGSLMSKDPSSADPIVTAFISHAKALFVIKGDGAADTFDSEAVLAGRGR